MSYFHLTSEERYVISHLVLYVKCKLEQDWSPEQITNRLTVDYPNGKTMRICHETIYQWIYSDAKNGGDLYTHFRRHHKRRRKQRRYGSGRGLIPGRISISKRPEVVDNQKRFGDWAGDTVKGAKGSGGIASQVERKRHLQSTMARNSPTSNSLRKKQVSLFILPILIRLGSAVQMKILTVW